MTKEQNNAGGSGVRGSGDEGKDSRPAPLSSNERTIFEQWADQHGYAIERRPAPYTNSENRSGNYRSDLVQAMWDTWEARAAMRQDETEARHTLDCDMVKHPNCTHCNCGSSIDTHRSSSGQRSDQPHTRAQVILGTASGSVRVLATDPRGTPQDTGRASGSEFRHEREPNPGSGVPAPGAAVRCACGHSDQSHFIGSTDINGPCGVCSCMEWSPEEPNG